MVVNIVRGTTTIQSVQPTSARLSMGISGQKYVEIVFMLGESYDFAIGDTVDVKSETFYLNVLPTVQKVSDHGFKYTATFEAAYYDLSKIQFMYLGQNEFYFNGTLTDIMDILMENVHRAYGAGHLTLGGVEATEFRNLYFKNQSCMQVLNMMMKEWEMEYYWDVDQLNIQETIGSDSGETFRYGKGIGLRSLQRDRIDYKNVVTRLWAVGSERNIPWDYRPDTSDSRNLLKRSGAVDLVDAIDIDGRSTKTYEGGNRWKFVNNGTGVSRIKVSVDHTLLTDSSPYTASVYWTGLTGGTIGIEWCSLTGYSTYSTGSGRCQHSGSRVYDDTYDYAYIHIASGSTVILYDCQIESGSSASAYEGGYSLTGGRFTRRLMFASPGSHYLESNVSTYGLIEHTKTFDDVYPRFTGRVTSVGTELQFCCSDVDFDLNSYLISGVEVTVHFNTGDCAGFEFTLQKASDTYDNGYIHTGGSVGDRQFTIIQNQDKQGYTVPTATGIKPAVGDEFVILNIEMPSSYITAAETELQNVAQAYLDDNDSPRVSYKVEVDPAYAAEKGSAWDFVLGDAITLVDSDINVNRLIRIVDIEYNLLRDGDMSLKLSDELEPNLIGRMEAEEERMNLILGAAPINQTDMMVGYRSILEMQHLIFDGTGYFEPENIKPLSIETLMLTVGSKWYAFTLECTMDANYNGTTTIFDASAGRLIHYTMDDAGPVTWTLTANNQTGLISGSAYYIYAYCHKTNYTDASNQIVVDTTQRDVDGTTHWNFLVGILHSAADGYRDISLTYGMSQINGGFITTGRIESIDGNTYFDLNNSEIGGKITFVAGSSGYANISDIPTSLNDISTTEYAKYESHNSIFDQTSTPTASAVGDLWIKDDDSVMYWTGSSWIEAETYNSIRAYYATSMGKTIYYQELEPTSGMVEGDIWVDTNDFNKTYVYYDSTWTETNSAESLSAYALADGKVVTFYQTTEPSGEGEQVGDYWVHSTTGDTKVYNGSTWEDTTNQGAIDAQATADGKVTTFYDDGIPSEPTAEGIGDLWFNTTNGKLFRWDGTNWNQDVADVTQTIIDGGLITTGRLEVQNDTTSQGGITGTTSSGSTAIGLWLGSTYANRATAPFRVTHGGAATMTNATIQSSTGTGQRVVIDGTDNKLEWYNSSNAVVMRMDDSIYGSQPGLGIYGDGMIYLNDGTSDLWIEAEFIDMDKNGSGTADYAMFINSNYVKTYGAAAGDHSAIAGWASSTNASATAAYIGVTGLADASNSWLCIGVSGSAYSGTTNRGITGYASGGTTAIGVYGYTGLGTNRYGGYFKESGGGTIDRALYTDGKVQMENLTSGSAAYQLYIDASGNVSYSTGSGTTSPLTTKGDIWIYSTTDDRLPVGTNGQVLSADSTETTGLKWIDSSGGINMTNGANNYVTTAVDADTINAESTLLYSSNKLHVGSGQTKSTLGLGNTGTYSYDICGQSTGMTFEYYLTTIATVNTTRWQHHGTVRFDDAAGTGVRLLTGTADGDLGAGNLSGHITTSGSLATTLGVTAISGQPELTVSLASTDELLVNDNGTLRRMDISVLETYMETNLDLGDVSASTYTEDDIAVWSATAKQLEDTGGTVTYNSTTGMFTTGDMTAANVRVQALSGASTRMVTCDVDGDLGSATLPTDYTHPNHSGHVTSSGDGAQTLVVAAITGQTAGTVLATTDEFIYSDGGVIKRIDASVIESWVNSQFYIGDNSSDINLSGLSDGDVLEWYLTGGYWRPVAAGTGTVTAVNNGSGMNFTNITTSGTVTLGTPTTCTASTANGVTTSSHTHAITGFVEIGTGPTANEVMIWEDTTTAKGDGSLTYSAGVLTTSSLTISALSGASTRMATISSAGVVGATTAPPTITITNESNNRVMTAVTTDSLNAEANLTFDGSKLTVLGECTIDNGGTPLATGDLNVCGNSETYSATFFNDGNSTARKGIKIQCGLDTFTSPAGPPGDAIFADFYDGNGTQNSYIYGDLAGSYLQSASDARLKTNIRDTERDAKAIVMGVKVRDFNWIKAPDIDITGYIAQEVEEVFPEMVHHDKETDLYTVGATRLIPYLHKVIQEQQHELEMLKEAVQSLLEK